MLGCFHSHCTLIQLLTGCDALLDVVLHCDRTTRNNRYLRLSVPYRKEASKQDHRPRQLRKYPTATQQRQKDSQDHCLDSWNVLLVLYAISCLPSGEKSKSIRFLPWILLGVLHLSMEQLDKSIHLLHKKQSLP